MDPAAPHPRPAHLRDWLRSPRRRRRLAWTAALLLPLALGVSLAVTLLHGTSNAFPDRYSSQPAQLYHPERHVPISKGQLALARRFIETAVARQELDAIYPFIHADLKGRMTRQQWDSGDIPVIYYPAENARTAAFLVDYSLETEALLEVTLVTTDRQQRPELLFYLGLKRAGGTKTGRWQVSYWEPNWRPPVPMAPG